MKKNILVVDDEKEIADLIELYLKNEDFNVFKCYTGNEAIKCIEKEKIDLAILDVMLPDIDGFSVCRKIREKYNYPIIMLTAKGEEIDKVTGLTIGADAYLTKPFRPLELIANVKAQLRRATKYNNLEEKEEINLNFMLAQLADEFYPILSKRGHSIELDLQDNMTIFADRDKLARVFSNLLKNAISYSYENSVIKIKAKQDKKNTVINFVNTGKVIPKQKLNNIFEKFFRLDSSRATNTGGAGLGLAIAKNIVLQHGGDISAESNEKETTFSVKIPNYKVED